MCEACGEGYDTRARHPWHFEKPPTNGCGICLIFKKAYNSCQTSGAPASYRHSLDLTLYCDQVRLRCEHIYLLRPTRANCQTPTLPCPYKYFPTFCESAVLSDAITLAEKLKILYIWIDLLCIVQDDPYDWTRESSSIAGIYANGYLTIAAASSADCSEGFRKQSPQSRVPVTADTPLGPARVLGRHLVPPHPTHSRTMPWT